MRLVTTLIAVLHRPLLRIVLNLHMFFQTDWTRIEGLAFGTLVLFGVMFGPVRSERLLSLVGVRTAE